MGTWTLNESRSKLAGGTGKNTKVVYEQVGDQIKVELDGIDGMGKARHNEWTGKFDGKDYPVTGNTNETRSYKQVDANTVEFTMKSAGKELGTRIVVSADGKSRTVTTNFTDKEGKKATSVAVYDKTS